MISVVDPSKTRRWIYSSCNWRTWRWMGPALYLTCLWQKGFPFIGWAWWVVLVAVVRRLSWRQRFPEIKFPTDPESRRAWTGTQTLEAVRITMIVRGCILATPAFITLTIGRGGRIGHVAITCPPALQYKHRPWVSHLCRSEDERRVMSTSMASWPGFGVLRVTGCRRSGKLGEFWIP